MMRPVADTGKPGRKAQARGRQTPVILAEKGSAKYTPERMQGAHIRMHVLSYGSPGDMDGLAEQMQEVPEFRERRINACFYLMGPEAFIQACKEILDQCGLKYSREYRTEDEFMEGQHKSFPPAAPSSEKQAKKKRSAFQDAMDGHRKPGLPDDELAACMAASEDLDGCLIFPYTAGNIRAEFIKKLRPYLADASRAENIADVFLHQGRQNGKP